MMIRIAVFFLALTFSAKAHGPAKWIEDGGYKNALGELCCGEKDCFEIAPEGVLIEPSGYTIKPTGEKIPLHEASPSPGGYWACYWGGKRKCFFAPLPSN